MNAPAFRRTACLLVLATAACNSSGEKAGRDTAGAVSTEALQPALATITSDNILQHVNRLASDGFEGRGPGTAVFPCRGATFSPSPLVTTTLAPAMINRSPRDGRELGTWLHLPPCGERGNQSL